MNVFKIFTQRSRLFYVFISVLGIVNSITYLGILMFLNTAIGGAPLPFMQEYGYIVYTALIALSFLCSRFFQNYMVDITNGILYNLELSIVQKLRHSSYQSFEQVGSEKIYAAIGDTRILSRVPEAMINLINASVTIVCALSYLFWVSYLGGVVVLGLLVVLAVIYLYRNGRIDRDLNKVRDLQDGYYGSVRELLDGFKEIKMSRSRNDNLYEKYIRKNRNQAETLSNRTSKKYVTNELIGVYSWYIILGVIIFALPRLIALDGIQVSVFITTVLFMIAPISQLIMFFPFYTNVKIAMERIDKIENDLQEDMPAIPLAVTANDFTSVRFENITYEYADKNNNSTFRLEPLNLTIRNGEVIFITGGNGSGKSTFINILTGLFTPASGQIYIDNKQVSWAEYQVFKEQIAAVFSIPYLFQENYDEHDLSEKNQPLNYFRRMLNLENILRIDTQQNIIDTKLSKGQQKRLALLMSLLENKPLLVLDEWAADQDPQNRSHFYKSWIEEIRQMGKTVIAVTHDDDYYHLADRVIKFNYGRIVSDGVQTEAINYKTA